MKQFILTFSLLFLYSCNSSDDSLMVKNEATSIMTEEKTLGDFDKKKDEGCSTEDDLKKQIEQAAKKAKEKKSPQAFKLQGGDTGCSTGE